MNRLECWCLHLTADSCSCTINARLLNLLHPSLRVMTSCNARGCPHKNLHIACDDEMYWSCWFAVYFTHHISNHEKKALAKILCFIRCTTSGLILKIFLHVSMILWGTKESVFTVLTVLQVNHSLWVLGVFSCPPAFWGPTNINFIKTFSMIWEQFGDYVHFPAWCNTM